MDSLLYVGAADDDEDEIDGEEEAAAAAPQTSAAGSLSGVATGLDYAALQRCGYSAKAADLRQTETFKRLDEEAKEKVRDETAKKAAEAAEDAAAEEALMAAQMDPKAIDERLGYQKRFDKTKEDFRSKEKRKRSMGQQNSGGDWVQEEKRRLRHGMTGNYDS